MIRELTTSDLCELVSHSNFCDSIIANTDYWELLVNHPASKAWSYWVNDKLMAAGGAVSVCPGNGEVWLAVTDTLMKKPKRLLVEVRKMIEHLKTCGLYHRLQMVIAPTDKLKSWAEHLGFSSEGLMKKYSPDQQDMIRYGLVWD